jgi:signal transduction histidine kinase
MVLGGLHPGVLGGLPFLRVAGAPTGVADPTEVADPAEVAGPTRAADPTRVVDPAGRTWPRWPFRSGWVDAAWVVFTIGNLGAMLVFSHWETVPFHVIWISLTILYGFRVWALQPTLWVLVAVVAATGAVLYYEVWARAQPVERLTEVPLLAAMFWAMVWHARRRLAAEEERARISAENGRLLATQRRFLQDASHQLRTPITIALGHAELLASQLAGTDRREAHDIEVVVGELSRLRRLGERLLMIAAAEDPDFLRPEPVALDLFTMDVLRKWMPTAPRRWQLGRLDPAVVNADRERLGLAVDALLENAVRHTADGGSIQLSSLLDYQHGVASLVIADNGVGIRAAELAHIFDRFRSGSEPGGGHRTGLGLALVRAVAYAHGGAARVRSKPGEGSRFELMLPLAEPPEGPWTVEASPDPALAGGGSLPAGAPPGPRRPGPGQTALEDTQTTLEDTWPGRTR